MVYALDGEHVGGEYSSEGIRRRRGGPGAVVDCGVEADDGVCTVVVEVVLGSSPAENETLDALAGIDTGDGGFLSVDACLRNSSPGPFLFPKTGVKVLRNSVYAAGGVMDAVLLSSRLGESEDSEMGLSYSSEGNGMFFGVLRGGRDGFEGVMMPDSRYVSSSMRYECIRNKATLYRRNINKSVK